jgi:hypothetical protein
MCSLIKVCDREIRVEGRLLRTARLEADGYHFLDDPQPLLDGIRRCGTRIDLFTFVQRLPETSPKYDFPMEWDNLAALPISTFKDWWTRQIDNKTRNMIRKAEKKGVVVREVPFDEGLAKAIMEVYNESPVRQGAPNKHYGKALKIVHQEEATFLETSAFIGAFLGNELIGFIKLTWDETKTQAGLMNIVSMVQHRDKAPTNALVAQAVRFCAERGIQYLVYSRFAYGKKQRSSLSDFKERNGFQRVDVPRYRVPLTLIGRLAVRWGLYKNFADYFPEPVLAKYRGLRSAWYKRRHQSVAEGS